MLGVGITSLTLAVTSIGVGFGIQNSRAANFVENNSADVSALFKHDGSYNVTLARQLLSLSTVASVVTANFPNGAKYSTVDKIWTANGNANNNAPMIRLFESSTGVMPDISAGNFRLANSLWILSLITFPSTWPASGDPIFTFLLRNVYAISIFGATNDYTTSTVRAKLRTDFETTLLNTHFQNAANAFVTPRDLAARTYNWHNWSGVGTTTDNLNAACLDDKIILPAWQEFGGNPTVGLFLNATNLDSNHCWSRGPNSVGRTDIQTLKRGSNNFTIESARDEVSWSCGITGAAVHLDGARLKTIVYEADNPVVPGDDNGGDDGDGNGGDDGNGGSDGVDPTKPVGPNNPIVPSVTDEQNNKGLSAGAIGGIIGGSLVAVGGATCGVIYFIARRKKVLA